MGIFASLDAAITDVFGQWNTTSTGLATAIILIVSYQIFSIRDPDTHPMLLAKQTVPSTVRNEGESAVYRSHASPHSMPLNAGLNVRDPGVGKWSRGRDGDLRDVWRRAAMGGDDGAKGKILTVLGTENIVDNKLDNITRQINLIGRHIADQGGIRVAVYLPNSVELLATLFACSFYSNLTTVLIPFDVSNDQLISMLRRSAADTVITAPGAFPLDAVVRAYPSLRQLIWVVDEGNNHMDWNEVPEGMGGSVNVATWQDIVRDAPAAAGAELPELDRENTPQDVVTFWQGKPGQVEEMVRFSQANLVAAISGQMFAVPSKEKFTSADLFLPADSLAHVHTLVLTLTALYQNASIALNSVTGGSDDTLDLELASRGIAPTVIVANPQTLLKLHENSMKRVSSGLARLSHSMATRAVVQEGVLAASGPWRSFNASAQPLLGTTPGKLRLVYAAERVAAGTPLLPAKVLSDLRILTGARVVYALTAPKVAGSVAQTAFYDYRVADGGKTHFGAPPTCVELLFRDMGENKTTDDRVEGEIFARGPCVAGGESGMGIAGRLLGDNTLGYV